VSGFIPFSSQLLKCFLRFEDQDEAERLLDHFDKELTDQDPVHFLCLCLSLI